LTNTKLESGVFFTQTLAFRYRLFELSLQNLVVAHESTPKKETTKADCQLSTLLLQPLSSDQTRPSGIIKPIMVALEETISMPLVVTEHGTIRIKGSRVVARRRRSLSARSAEGCEISLC